MHEPAPSSYSFSSFLSARKSLHSLERRKSETSYFLFKENFISAQIKFTLKCVFLATPFFRVWPITITWMFVNISFVNRMLPYEACQWNFPGTKTKARNRRMKSLCYSPARSNRLLLFLSGDKILLAININSWRSKGLLKLKTRENIYQNNISSLDLGV